MKWQKILEKNNFLTDNTDDSQICCHLYVRKKMQENRTNDSMLDGTVNLKFQVPQVDYSHSL